MEGVMVFYFAQGCSATAGLFNGSKAEEGLRGESGWERSSSKV